MVFDPLIGEPLLDQIDKRAQDELQQKLVEKRGVYWVKCPGCGRTVVRKELLKKGCYLCRWQGTEEDIELARRDIPDEVTEDSTLSEIGRMTLYRVDCPQCQTKVVREQLMASGCYLCGWRPAE